MTNLHSQIPPVLVTLYNEKRWPKFISNRKLRKLSSFITDEKFELFQSVDEVLGNNDMGTFDLFFELVKDDCRARTWKLTRGTESEHSLDPDWLNLDFALDLGGGARQGDDKWLALDLRVNRGNPRVIYNW